MGKRFLLLACNVIVRIVLDKEDTTPMCRILTNLIDEGLLVGPMVYRLLALLEHVRSRRVFGGVVGGEGANWSRMIANVIGNHRH